MDNHKALEIEVTADVSGALEALDRVKALAEECCAVTSALNGNAVGTTASMRAIADTALEAAGAVVEAERSISASESPRDHAICLLIDGMEKVVDAGHGIDAIDLDALADACRAVFECTSVR